MKTIKKPDVNDLLKVLSNKNVDFKDVQPLLDATGSTYAEDAVNRAYDYHDRWLGSPRMVEQTKDSLFNPKYDTPGRTQARWNSIDSNPSLQASLMNALSRDMPEKDAEDRSRLDILWSLPHQLLLKTSDEPLEEYYGSDDKRTFRNRKKELKKSFKKHGVEAPKVKGLSGHEERLAVANDMIKTYQDESLSRVLEYRRMMGERNPLDVQTEGSLKVRTPWRPKGHQHVTYDPFANDIRNSVSTTTSSGEGESEKIPGSAGVNVNLEGQHGRHVTPEGTMEHERYYMPYTMGLPKGLQESWSPGAAKLHKDPAQLEETATHERAHQLDLAGSDKDYVSEVLQRVTRIDENAPYGEKGYNDYVAEPTETNARIQVLRKHLFSAGIDVFNKLVDLSSVPESILNDLESSRVGNALSDLRAIYKDRDIEYLLNKLP